MILSTDRCILTDTSVLHPTEQTYRTLFISRESGFFYPKTYGSQVNYVFREYGRPIVPALPTKELRHALTPLDAQRYLRLMFRALDSDDL